MMNYSPYADTRISKFGLENIKDDAGDDNLEIEEVEMKQTHDEMFEHYKKNGNLNLYLYMYDEPAWIKDIEGLTKDFYDMLNNKKTKKGLIEEKKVEGSNIQQPKNLIPFIKQKSRKTETYVSRKISENIIFKERNLKNLFVKDCLDFDDLVIAELPEEYNADNHEDVMMSLGEDLVNTRKIAMSNLKAKKAEYMMSNDDFSLLLCLMRKKKELIYEKNPYYEEYTIGIEDVYRNEKEEFNGVDSKKEIDIEGFVKKYIDNDGHTGLN